MHGAVQASGNECGREHTQEAAWLEQQEALLAMQAAMPVQPIYTRMPPKKLRTPELDDAESQQYSPYPRFSRCAGLLLCMQSIIWDLTLLGAAISRHWLTQWSA